MVTRDERQQAPPDGYLGYRGSGPAECSGVKLGRVGWIGVVAVSLLMTVLLALFLWKAFSFDFWHD